MNQKEFTEKYYKKCKEQTLETLTVFIKQMMSEELNYGSCCCAIAASALAAAWASNSHPKGGITGFQAGAVMWEFISQWKYEDNQCGLRLINYDDMLYVQYKEKFIERVISETTFTALRREAQRLLDKDKAEREKFESDLKIYEADMKSFKRKFPDYDRNPELYERITSGTPSEWAGDKQA